MVKRFASLDHVFAALSDPTRREMLDRLARGRATVSDLAAGRRMTLAAVLKHLGVLENAGLVRTGKAGRVRHCELTPRPLAAVAGWIRNYEPLWNRRLENLSRYLDNKQRGDRT